MQYYQDRTNSVKLNGFWGNFKFACYYAFKSIIKGNRWAVALLIVVMAFSFINLIFVSSLISGVMTTLDNQMINTQFGNLIISPPANKYYIEKSDQLAARIAQLPGVSGAAEHLSNTAFIEYQWKDKLSTWDKGDSGNWEVIGIDPEQESQVTIISDQIIKGSYLSRGDRDKIVLGVEIAGGEEAQSSDFLTLGGVNIGDKVRLTYPNGIQREYKVKGIFYAREMVRADHLAFVTREEMASVLDRKIYSDRATEIIIKTEKGIGNETVINEIKGLGIDEQIRSWQEYGGAMRSVISTFDMIGSLIGSFGLVVSAAVMFIIIYINVLNRKRQIGIMRAIGIPSYAIIFSYLMQALFYVVMGVALGWSIVHFVIEPYFIYYPLDLPMGLVNLNVRSTTIIISSVGLLISGLMAGLIPSLTIMRNSIIKIIWGN